MSEIADLVKVLFTYGPSAFAVFVLVFAERRAYAVWTGADANDPKKSLLGWLYFANWFLIFGLIGMSLYVWTKTNISDEKIIQGVLGHVHERARVSADDNQGYLFLAAQPNRRSYRWRLISSKTIPEGTEVHIVNDRSRDNHEEYTIHLLRIRPSFYIGDVTLTYDESNNKLILRHQGKQEELEIYDQAPSPSNKNLIVPAERKISRNSEGETGLAYAMAPFSPTDFSERLESNDLATRRQAREELTGYGAEALPWIIEVLSSRDRSYRQRLGVIVAANGMSDAVLKKASADLINPVLDTSFFIPDETLNQEAYRLASRLSGLSGDGLKFFVIVASARTRDSAEKSAANLNRKSAGLKVRALQAQNGLYGLYVGIDLSFMDAVALRNKAIAAGFPKDTYIRAKVTDEQPDMP